MTKRILVIGALLVLLIAGGYLFIRFRYLKAKDFKPDTSKEKTVLDLRPSMIAKLQQLVKDGSGGLYILSIEKLEPDLLTSKVDLTNTSIRIDTAAMHHLDSLHQLPDDIFTFHFDTAHIDGMGISDLLNTDRVDIKGIYLSDPVIDIYHKKRSYNESEREASSRMTLYERVKGQLKKISISNININDATVTNHDQANNKISKFTLVSIVVNDLLVDSSTQHDKSRFLFAKHTLIHTKKYSTPTSDSMYYFKIGDISIAGERHTVTLGDVELVPRYQRQQFERKLKYRHDMYRFRFPKVIINDIDWLAIMNNEKFSSSHINIEGGMFSDFLDRSVPDNPSMQMNNFPHQLLMQVPFKVSAAEVEVKQVNVAYEEFNPLSGRSGTVWFDNVNARLRNISNVPGEIKAHPVASFSGNALFMHHVPMTVAFNFDLSKYKTGEFSSDFTIGTLDNATVNSFAEPLGPFSVKTGEMQHADLHVAGNNLQVTGSLTMTYSDLHITPLKKDKKEGGALKPKSFSSFFANIVFIKNENPKGGDLRREEFSVGRDHHSGFFNLIWKAALTGILKTIGIPVKLVIK